jgi:hypothetical protein
VINLISLLFSGALLSLRNMLVIQVLGVGVPVVAAIMSIVLVAVIAGMIFYSKRETEEEERVRDTEPPVSRDILVTPNPVKVNTPFAFTATIDDRETGGSKIVSAEYSLDGTAWSPMAAADGALDSPSEKIMAKTSVDKPGVYNLQVRGADEMGNVATEKAVVLVVYDPENGYVTGEGWVASPQGAFANNTSLTGKASFKFQAKYESGAAVPSGQASFTFSAADLTFKSTSYDWLVISGPEAICKGVGTINGGGSYGFELIGVDEKMKGEAKRDKFRLRIWEKITGKTIYDNGLGGPETIPPTTAISDGSVDIHRERKRAEKS